MAIKVRTAARSADGGDASALSGGLPTRRSARIDASDPVGFLEPESRPLTAFHGYFFPAFLQPRRSLPTLSYRLSLRELRR
jgi:hypothetical protein